MVEITTKEDFNKILNNPKVIIDFRAEWCGPCKVTKNNIEAIENEFNDVVVASIDVDNEALEDIVTENSIRSIPVLLVYNDGKLIDRKTGLQTKEQFSQICNSLMSI